MEIHMLIKLVNLKNTLRSSLIFLLFFFVSSKIVFAQEILNQWVPISVGDITIIIPVEVKLNEFSLTNDLNANDVPTSQDGNFTFNWQADDGIEHYLLSYSVELLDGTTLTPTPIQIDASQTSITIQTDNNAANGIITFSFTPYKNDVAGFAKTVDGSLYRRLDKPVITNVYSRSSDRQLTVSFAPVELADQYSVQFTYVMNGTTYTTSYSSGTYTISFPSEEAQEIKFYIVSEHSSYKISSTRSEAYIYPFRTDDTGGTVPKIHQVSPADDASIALGSTVVASALASDDGGIESVSFSLTGPKGQNFGGGKDTSAPYSWDYAANFTTNPQNIGSYTLKVDAYDAYGKTASSTTSFDVYPEAPLINSITQDGDTYTITWSGSDYATYTQFIRKTNSGPHQSEIFPLSLNSFSYSDTSGDEFYIRSCYGVTACYSGGSGTPYYITSEFFTLTPFEDTSGGGGTPFTVNISYPLNNSQETVGDFIVYATVSDESITQDVQFSADGGPWLSDVDGVAPWLYDFAALGAGNHSVLVKGLTATGESEAVSIDVELVLTVPEQDLSVVYKDTTTGDLYLQLSDGSYLKLTQVGGTWSASEITSQDWDALTLTVSSSYSVEFGNFTDDELEDFKLIDNTNETEIVFEQVACTGNGCSNNWVVRVVEPVNPEVAPTAHIETIPEAIIGDTVGTLPGEVIISSQGTAGYKIPLVVPKGIGGSQPQLSLNYNSQGGNHVLGVGWSIGGLSAIERCRRTPEKDGYIRGIKFDSEDALCMDGQRLKLVNGTDGEHGAQYRTELESLRQVTLDTTSDYSHFTVAHTDGSKWQYGNSTTSVQKDGESGIAYIWLLNAITDAAGNSTNFTYVGSDTVVKHISQITYSGNTIDFDYEVRTDTSSRYFLGNHISDVQRLESITVNHNNAEVNHYKFEYDQSSFSSRSLLNSLQRCNHSDDDTNSCLPATVFDYSEPLLGFANNTSLIDLDDLGMENKEIFGITSLDYNADGLQDLALAYRSETTGQGYIQLLRNTGSGYTGGHVFLSEPDETTRSGEDIYSPHWLIADIDGNGTSDLMYAESCVGSECTWKIKYFDPDGTISDTQEYQFPSSFKYSIFADMDVDGRPDILTDDGYYHNTNSVTTRFIEFVTIDLSHVKQERWDNQEELEPADLESSVEGGFFGLRHGMSTPLDFNADGQPDLSLAYYFDYCELQDQRFDCDDGTTRKMSETFLHPMMLEMDSEGEWTASSSQVLHDDYDVSTGRSETGYADTIPNHFRYGDINGDGYTDILSNGYLFKLDGEQVHEGFFAFRAEAYYQPSYYGYDKLMDLNGDGLSDIVYKSDNDTSPEGFYVRFSNGTTFDEEEHFLFYSDVTDPEDDSVIWVDMDGDGMSGVIILDKINNNLILRKDANIMNQPQDVLKKVTNGLGAVSDIIYQSMNNANLYTLGESSNTLDWGNGSAVIDIISSSFLVSHLTVDVAINDSDSVLRSTFAYSYSGLRLQSGGRGFLGFEQFTSTDQRTSISSTTTYRQDFPFTGHAINRTVEYNNMAVQTVVNTPASLSLNGGANQYIYNANSEQKKYSFDYNGSIGSRHAVSTVNTVNTYETYSEGVVTIDGSYPLLTNQEIITTDHSQANDIYSQTTIYGYSTANADSSFDDETNWWIGKVKSKTITNSRTGKLDLSQSMAYEYDLNTGLLTAEIIDPDGADDTYLKTAYAYDAFGNRINTTQCSSHYKSDCATRVNVANTIGTNKIFRRTQWSYDPVGRYITQVSNLLFTEQKFSNYNALGQPTQHIDVDGNITEIRYDDFGQEFFRRTSGVGTFTYTSNFECTSGFCPSNATYYTSVISEGNVTEKQYFDFAGNLLKKTNNGFNSEIINTLFKYDNFARAYQKSVAHFNTIASGNIPWQHTQYDIFGRTVIDTAPNGTNIIVSYSENKVLKAVSVNHNGYIFTRNRSESLNALGETVSIDNGLNAEVLYSYDAIGKLDIVTGADNAIIDADHDAWGRKTRLNDPDKGDWNYGYNALGEQIKITAPDDAITNAHYDNVGRVYSRISTNEALATLDSADFNFVAHQLKSEQQGEVEKTFDYDSQGRVSTITTVLDNITYSQSITYDQFGRVFQQFDADTGDGMMTSKGLRYHYKNGFVSKHQEAREGVNGVYYYQVDDVDAMGNVTEYRQGKNETITVKGYDNSTGFLESVNSGMGMIQSLDYEFDGVGNLRLRADNINEFMGTTEKQEEVFIYDELNRLTTVEQNGFTSLSMTYDLAGNLQTKSDVLAGAQYNYQAKANICTGISGSAVSGPHAVSSISTRQYCYDVKGNQTHQFDGNVQTRKVVYSHYDKPTLIESSKGSTTFSYDMNRTRYKRVDSLENEQGVTEATTTYYLGNVEVIVKDNGITEYKRYIGDGALETVRSDNSRELVYLFKDHIGSTDVITDEEGLVQERLSFDAFGKRRIVDEWQSVNNISEILNLSDILDITSHGFTGHEQVDHANVIHMNGRIYDPSIGRFMQADPIIQEVDNSQNFNRYSYVLNNPLSYTDPTGYMFSSAFYPDEMISKMQDDTQLITPTIEGVFVKTPDGVLKSSTNDGGKDSGTNVSGTPSGGGSLQDQIKSDAHNSIVRGGEELGVDMGGSPSDGVNAQWGNITRDKDGNIIRASVICGASCKAEAGLYSYNHSMDLIRIRNQNNYGALATKSLAYTGLGFVGSYYAISAGGSYLAASPPVKALLFEFMAQASMDVRAIRTMMQMDTIPAHMQSLLRGAGKWGNVTKGRLPPKPRLKIGKSGKPHMPIYNKGE